MKTKIQDKTFFYILLPMFLLLLVACGGLHTRFSIESKNLISGEELTLKIRVERSNVSSPSQRFSVSMDLDGLADAVKKADDSVAVTSCQDRLLLIQTKSGFFYMMPVDNVEGDQENDSRYAFFAPVAMFRIDSKEDTFVNMYVPYHLIDEVEIQTVPGYPEYPRPLTCDACGSMEEFVQFYRAWAQCDVNEMDKDTFIVTYKENTYRMKLTFYQDGDQPKVTFDILD